MQRSETQWPNQFASLVRVQRQLRLYLKLQGSVKGGIDCS